MFESFFGILTFFATILVLVTGVFVIGISLLTRHFMRAGRIGLILLGWIAVYAVILLTASFTSQPRYLSIGQERCFDEMCYSVTAVTITPTLTNDFLYQLKARGNFYLVTVQLRNAARREAQKPSNPDLFVIGAGGKIYSSYIDMRASGGWGAPTNLPGLVLPLWDQKIQPGETSSLTVAFDLPVDIRQPGLVVTEGIGPLSVAIIGDENSLFHAKTEFQLIP